MWDGRRQDGREGTGQVGVRNLPILLGSCRYIDKKKEANRTSIKMQGMASLVAVSVYRANGLTGRNWCLDGSTSPQPLSKANTHPLTHSLALSLKHPLTHSFTQLALSPTHPPTHPPTHSLTHSLTHSHTHHFAGQRFVHDGLQA